MIGSDFDINKGLDEADNHPRLSYEKSDGIRYSLLIVDDDVDVCDFLKIALSRMGFEIAIAHDAESALWLCSQQAVDIIISDLNMPQKNGIELMRILEDICPHTLRIIMTGNPDLTRIRDASREQVIHGFFLKPVSFDQLSKMVEQWKEHCRI